MYLWEMSSKGGVVKFVKMLIVVNPNVERCHHYVIVEIL